MANEEHLNILNQGVRAWNEWRKTTGDIKPDLTGAYLSGGKLMYADLTAADLRDANLYEANLREAILSDANLSGARMQVANLGLANLQGAHLSDADLSLADCLRADLRGANLRRAKLQEAILTDANLSGADLGDADLSRAIMVGTNLSNSNLANCKIFGISAWEVNLAGAKQSNLVITRWGEPEITVDNIEVAQFVYLLLHNEKIRDVITTIGQKAVLILGRFALPERKEILDAMRNMLREKGFLPIVFDFEKSEERDFTETVKTLAGMSLFVIADITNPKSSPLELQATVPDYMIPFVPIIQVGEQPFAMFIDLQHKFRGVLEVRQYNDKDHLLRNFENGIIKPALAKHNELLILKNEALNIRSIDEI